MYLINYTYQKLPRKHKRLIEYLNHYLEGFENYILLLSTKYSSKTVEDPHVFVDGWRVLKLKGGGMENTNVLPRGEKCEAVRRRRKFREV